MDRRTFVLFTVIFLSLSGCAKEKVSRRSAASSSIDGEGDKLAFNGQDCRKSEPTLMLADSSKRLSDPALTEKLTSLVARLPKQSQASLHTFSEQGPITTIDYRYSYRNVPVCELQTVMRLTDGSIYVSGEPPIHPMAAKEMTADHLLNAKAEWPEDTILVALVAKQLAVKPEAIRILSSEKCAALDSDRVSLAKDMHLEISGQMYAALVQENRVRSLVDETLHASGSARIFSENSVKNELSTMQLHVTSANGRLSGPRFRTERTDGIEPLTSSDFVYVFAPDTPQFEEVSAYTHAEKAADWLTLPSHGYKLDCTPIAIQLVSSYKDSKDNAAYLEPKGNTPARLVFGPGGGTQGYRNLRSDYDVIAHELGHHVVTRKLSKKTLEQREIHEGLADYLVYAATGDTCLGEAVTPNCELRPIIGNDTWKSENHRKDQPYLNGSALALTLWKLRNDPDFSPEKVDAMVFAAIDGLRLQSGYTDLLTALLIANKGLNKGTGACKLLNTFQASGFDSFAKGISCSDYGP